MFVLIVKPATRNLRYKPIMIIDAQIVYVPAIPEALSGIGRDVPAHAKVVFLDGMGRRCSWILDLGPEDLRFMAQFENNQKRKY